MILAKATGGAGHGGGDRFPARPNDPEYDTFAAFVDRAAVCQSDPPVSAARISLGTGYEQLHKITVALGARLPTIAEVSASVQTYPGGLRISCAPNQDMSR